MKTWIMLSCGRQYDFNAPDWTDIPIEWVAETLSREGRFTNQTPSPYDVAQHSVLVSYLVPQGLEYWGLMHDGHEAVTRDFSTPAKRAIGSAWYAFEMRQARAFRKHWGLGGEEPAEVKAADGLAFAIERANLFPDYTFWPADLHAKRIYRWDPVSADDAKEMFLARFDELSKMASALVESSVVNT